MATSVVRDANHPEVVIASAGKNETTAAIETREYSKVSVQLSRSGSTQTATIQQSNDGTNWVTAKATDFEISEGAGEHTSVTGLSSGLYQLLRVSRFVRLVVSNATDGATDVLTATFLLVK